VGDSGLKSHFIAFPKFEACIEGEGSSHAREILKGGRGGV